MSSGLSERCWVDSPDTKFLTRVGGEGREPSRELLSLSSGYPILHRYRGLIQDFGLHPLHSVRDEPRD